MGWFRDNLARVYVTMGRWLNLLPDGLTSAGTQRIWGQTSVQDRYRILRAYYESNDLYAQVQTALEDRAGNKYPLMPIRNPAHQVVEFYVTNLWRGQAVDVLAIEAENEAIVDPIHRIWRWSNWNIVKQKAARWLARDGDLFIKVVQSDDGDQVYFQLIDALTVADFDTDKRDNVNFIRLDTPQVAVEGQRTSIQWLTETWSKADQVRRVWRHDKGYEATLDSLGAPLETEPLTDYGIDFVPFVHVPFIDTGGKRGRAAIEAALDKIDESNRKATRLSKQLYRHNDVTWAVESDLADKQGRPLPPPAIDSSNQKDTRNVGNDDVVELGGERFLKLPSGWHLTSTVPALDYQAALSILQDDMRELERDLPEMTYFRLREQGELSGRAIQLKLGDAITRAEEVQANALDGLVRANKMALSIGQAAEIEGFEEKTIGVYESGDFEHTITPPTILPVPRTEKVQTLATLLSAMPAAAAMRLLKFSEEEIADVQAEIEAERNRQEQDRAQATLQALRDIQAQQTLAAPQEG